MNKNERTEERIVVMDLLELRGRIDEIDQQIVALYEKRMEVSKQVAEYKIETGKRVFDKAREEEKIQKVKSLTHNDFNSHGDEQETAVSAYFGTRGLK